MECLCVWCAPLCAVRRCTLLTISCTAARTERCVFPGGSDEAKSAVAGCPGPHQPRAERTAWRISGGSRLEHTTCHCHTSNRIVIRDSRLQLKETKKQRNKETKKPSSAAAPRARLRADSMRYRLAEEGRTAAHARMRYGARSTEGSATRSSGDVCIGADGSLHSAGPSAFTCSVSNIGRKAVGTKKRSWECTRR